MHRMTFKSTAYVIVGHAHFTSGMLNGRYTNDVISGGLIILLPNKIRIDPIVARPAIHYRSPIRAIGRLPVTNRILYNKLYRAVYNQPVNNNGTPIVW